MVSVLQSPSAAERLAAARRFLTSAPLGHETLIIGATREAADDLAREVTATLGATFGIHRVSLRQLAHRLAAGTLTDAGLSPTTALGIEAVAARAVFEVEQRRELSYFRPVSTCPGFARSVASTLTELRLAGVGPDDVQPIAPVGADLAALLEEFQDQLDRAALADDAALYRAALDAVRARRPDPIVTVRLLLLDVPVRSVAERDLIRALAQASPESLATVPAGDESGLEAVTGTAAAAASHLPATPCHTSSALDRLKHHLFASDAPPAGEPDDEVHFFSAPGEARECVEVARRVLDEARAGVAFDRIGILVRVPSLYTSPLETALRRAGVPAYFARGTSRPDPSGRALLSLLACASERLSAKRFAEYLSLGQVPDLPDDGGPPMDREQWEPPRLDALADSPPVATEGSPVQGSLPFGAARASEPTSGHANDANVAEVPADADAPVIAGTLRTPWRWEELLVEAAVIGGRDRWARRLEGLEAEVRLKVAEIRNDEPDSPRIPALERELVHLAHLRRFALPLIEILDDLPEQATWGDWLERLNRLASMALDKPTRVLAVLAELQPMSVVGPVGLEEVRDVLLERLANLEVEPHDRRFGCVFVATPEQARGRRFDVVFVPGLAERVFPQKAREDPLLLDQARELVGARVLRTQRHRAPDERLLLRLAVGSAERRVHLSYPRMGTELGEPRPRVPSFYGLDVDRATTGRLPDIDILARRAADASQARLAWPAPPQAERAIDEIEHDLSILGNLLRPAPPGAARGRARYLLDLNEHLARSLRTRWGRWEEPRWSRFDGLTRSTPTTQTALAPHRPTARAYSVTALQHYAACPYRFVLSGIYRLEPREEVVPIQHMDPLTRGSIFHQVQAEFLRAMEQTDALPVSADTLGAAVRVLDATLGRVAEERREELSPAIPRVWEDDITSMRADLRSWVHLMAADTDWLPIRFEFGFGMPVDGSRDPRSVPAPAVLEGGFKLHGIVDLIERSTSTSNVRVTDHKTGVDRTSPGLVTGGGEVLQPVLYGLAIEAATGETVESARLFFCTRRGGFGERPVAMDPLARERGLEVLRQIDTAMDEGFLPPAPREGACRFCDFVGVCGPHEETRVHRKDQRPLRALTVLRQQP